MRRRRRARLAAVACLLATCAGAAPAPSWQPEVDALGLPLTIVPATTPVRAVLVFLSGDGGWAAVDQAVSAGLAARGVTTVGWSSLRYFTTTQPKARVAIDLARVVRAIGRTGVPVYVGGYSFGAEVAPVVVAQEWSAAARARLAGMLLLAPSASATFRVNPLDWVREPPPDPAARVDDAVRRLSPLPVLCVTGVDDATAVCGDLTGIAGVEVVRVPGTHHFENGIPQLVDAAMARLFTRPPEAR